MALFFNRISKLSARRDNARFLSSLPQSPYLMLGCKGMRESPEELIVRHLLFDPTTETRVYTEEKILLKELYVKPLLGASQGWVACVDNKDHTVHLTDVYKPWLSSTKVISLPSIGFSPTTYATRVSLSSSDPVQDDFFVVAKFSEYQLSVCKPRWDSKWTHISTPCSFLPTTEFIYSKRDKTFYVTSFKGHYMSSLDLVNKKLKHQHLRLRNQPKIPVAGWEMLDQCSMTNHLVEAPSGQLFFIKWYAQCIHREDKDGNRVIIYRKSMRFMVFREEGEKSKDFCYTEDIGDLCIFIGKSEAFCLSASMYPGLKPNSIYYLDPKFGSYNIASGTDHPLKPQDKLPLIPTSIWLHPTNPIA